MLRETISNLPVIIVEEEVLTEIIEKELLDNIDNIVSGKYLPSNNQKNYDFRIIPYSSLGNDNGILVGIKPDYIKIYTDEYYEEKEAFVGIYKGNLCGGTNKYNAIVGL